MAPRAALYLAVMDQASDQPHPAERRPSGVDRAEEERAERFGPLKLLRTRKADGRALLLFSRASEREDR